MAPEERAKYWESRADRLEALAMKLNGERDALAAHVERFAELLDMDGGEAIDRLIDLVNERPETSLEQRDSRMKAEALDKAAEHLDGEGHTEWENQAFGDGLLSAAIQVREMAEEYRQQAEGIE